MTQCSAATRILRSSIRRLRVWSGAALQVEHACVCFIVAGLFGLVECTDLVSFSLVGLAASACSKMLLVSKLAAARWNARQGSTAVSQSNDCPQHSTNGVSRLGEAPEGRASHGSDRPQAKPPLTNGELAMKQVNPSLAGRYARTEFSPAHRGAHLMERIGLAMVGLCCGLFVSAYLTRSGIEELTSMTFVAVVTVCSSAAFYLGIDLVRRPRYFCSNAEILSAVGTFSVALATLSAVCSIIVDADATALKTALIAIVWTIGICALILAGLLGRGVSLGNNRFR